MDVDEDRIDQAVLALMYLTLHDGYRAWKGFDWDVLDRLHERYDRRPQKQGEVRLADGRRPGRERTPVQGIVQQVGLITASGGQREDDNEGTDPAAGGFLPPQRLPVSDPGAVAGRNRNLPGRAQAAGGGSRLRCR